MNRSSKEFEEQMSLYRGVEGDVFPFIRCVDRSPSFSDLSPNELRYYLYWRSQLSRGVFQRSDEGYIRLRMHELINTRDDPAKTMDEIHFIMANLRPGDLKDGLRTLEFDYAFANGLRVPEGKPDTLEGDIWLSECLSSPPDPVKLSLILELTGRQKVQPKMHRNLETLFNLVLERVDRLMSDAIGSGVLESYGGKCEGRLMLFEGCPYFAGPEVHDLEYMPVAGEGRLVRFLGELVDQCKRALFIPVDGPDDRTFPATFVKVVMDSVRDAVSGRPCLNPAKSESASVRRPVPWEEQDMGDIIREGLETDVSAGEVVPEPYPSWTTPDSGLVSYLKMHWGTRIDHAPPYVRSGTICPDLVSMDDEQKERYWWWRQEVLSGRFPKTDLGYICLMLYDLVLCEQDPGDVAAVMARMAAAYGSDKRARKVIVDTYTDYCMTSGILDSDPALRGNCSVDMRFESMLKGEYAFDRDDFQELLGMDESTMEDLDDDAAEACCVAFKLLDGRKRLADYYGLMRMGMARRAFTTLAVYYPVAISDWTVEKSFDFSMNRTFIADGRHIVKGVVREMVRRKGGKASPVKAKVMDTSASAIAKESVNIWMHPRKRIDTSIDRDAVRVAEEDLHAVTEMMNIDGPDGADIASAPAAEAVAGDPWDAFVSSLDGEEAAFLASSLGGGVPMTGRMYGLEKSINSKSSSTVGDVVMEEGRVFEEYAERIGRLLFGRTA